MGLSTAYRFVSRLLITVPGASLTSMRRLLEPGGEVEFQPYIDRLGDTARSFFKNEFAARQFAETRQQILRRLYTVLENPSFEKMLGAETNAINIKSALDSGKVVLISTAKNYLKQTGATLLGRMFIAQVMQAVSARQDQRHRSYLYIDEFQDYADDSAAILTLFEQARKRELGLIVAHQYLGQLPPKLAQAIAANTSIKFAGGVSASDAKALAPQLKTTPEQIEQQPRGGFAAYCKGMRSFDYKVDLGRLDREPSINNISDIRAVMRGRYSVRDNTRPAENMPDVSDRGTKKDKKPPKADDVDETGAWE